MQMQKQKRKQKKQKQKQKQKQKNKKPSRPAHNPNAPKGKRIIVKNLAPTSTF